MISTATRTSSNSNVDFTAIKLESQKRLFDLLDRFEGTKTIIWDDRLIGPFEFVANATLLKQHDAIRLFRLSDVRPNVFNEIRTEYILFFLRRDEHVAKDVAKILRLADRVSLDKTSLVFVPNKCASFEKLLERDKVDLTKLYSIEELNIELFVLDTDVISAENENVFLDLYLKDNRSFAHQIAEGLIKLQNQFGQIPRISGQGKGAKLVCELLLRHRKHNPKSQQSMPRIQQLILIDRRIDLITPLLTQLTYEGLLDEVFGVKHGTITLPNERFAQAEEQQVNNQDPNKSPKIFKETKRIELRSTEALYARLRDCHINGVPDILVQSAKNLQAEREECISLGKTIPEMGKIVKRLNHLEIAKKSQTNHVTIAELINEQTHKAEFIYGLRIEHELLQEDRLNRIVPDIDTKLLRQEPAFHVLRLICLQSIISNGLKTKISDYYKREIFQNYGFNFIQFLLLLEKANLFLCKEKYYDVGSFSQLVNRLGLIRDDINECNPSHLSYVYGGYSPISIVVARILAQSIQSPMWRSQIDNLKLLPEPTINYSDSSHSQPSQSMSTNGGISINPIDYGGSLTSTAIAAATSLLSVSVAPGLRIRRNSTSSSQSSSKENRTILVFFIGGCTFAEISALRWLSQQEENCDFLIGTTKMINGKSFLQSIWSYCENLQKQHEK